MAGANNLGALRDVVARLTLSTGSLSVLGAAIDARVNSKPFDAQLGPYVNGVLDVLGARSYVDELSPDELRPMLAEIRLAMCHGAAMLETPARAAGWDFTDPNILTAAGDTSAGFANVFQRTIVPKLEGLGARLDAGATFLDVGSGVGALSIAMARLWPALRIVGIDPWAQSIALARARVRAAGLDARIELREQSAELLADHDVFDLAWIPSLFIPEPAIAAIVPRVHRAMKPGAWLLFAIANPGSDPLRSAYIRFRTALWGGPPLLPPQVETMLRNEGFVDVQTLPGPPSSPVTMIAGRKGA